MWKRLFSFIAHPAAKMIAAAVTLTLFLQGIEWMCSKVHTASAEVCIYKSSVAAVADSVAKSHIAPISRTLKKIRLSILKSQADAEASMSLEQKDVAARYFKNKSDSLTIEEEEK